MAQATQKKSFRERAFPGRGARVLEFIGIGYLGLAVIAAFVGLLRTGAEQTTLFVQSGTLLALLVMGWLVQKLGSSRPLCISALAFYITAIQPAALLLLTLSRGEVEYENDWGFFSFHTDTDRVALVQLLLFGTIFVITGFVARVLPKVRATWPEILRRLSPQTLSAFQWLAFAATLDRILVEFGVFNRVVPVAYVARLFTNYYSCSVFFVGVGLRWRDRKSSAIALSILPMLGLLLLSGNRSYALFPMAFAAAGYVIASPMSRMRMAVLGAGTVVLFTIAMYVGEVARQGEGGRDIGAAAGRISTLGAQMEESAEQSTVESSSLYRLLRAGDHGMITQIPEAHPFESDGVANLPEELMRDLWPGLNFSGRTEERLPRVFILNEIGFYVSWETSIPLALAPDAWYRGGYLGVFIVALLAGVALLLMELVVYFGMNKNPDKVLLILICCFGVFSLEQHDILHSLKDIIWSTLAGVVMVWALRAVTSRSSRQAAANPSTGAVAQQAAAVN